MQAQRIVNLGLAATVSVSKKGKIHVLLAERANQVIDSVMIS